MDGTTLKTVREARGLRLSDVAERASVDKGQLSKVERGQCGLGVESLARVAAVLGLEELERLLKPHLSGAEPR